MTAFKQLGLSDKVLKGLSELGFETPTEIQEEAIPMLLEKDRDLIGLAQTGTGKTAAFGLPLLEKIDPSQAYTQALVLAPTRELGQQIAEQLEKFSKYLEKVNVLAVYGGANIATQIKALKRPQHIIIATPGRLLDLIKRKSVKLDNLRYLILDEADEMLNMGFKEDLDEILSYTHKDKNTWLFSATMPQEIKRIVKTYMEEPVEVKVNTKNEVNQNIEHQFVIVRQADKTEALTRFLDLNPDMRGLVFCRTKRDTQNLAEILLKKGYKADALHGDLSQAQRDRVMKRFKEHDLHVLIATDVAARGIDVNNLSHVFHYALPDDNAYYTHRSGRTARAGKKGISCVFINSREGYKIERLAKQLGISFQQVMVPKNEDIVNIRFENWCLQVLETPTKGKINPQIMDKVNMLFANLSKEELIAKLAVEELEKLNLGSSNDLNVIIKDKKKDRDRTSNREERRAGKRDRKKGSERKNSRDEKGSQRGNRGERSSRSGETPRFFINLGTRDKVKKNDLIDFICEVSKVKRSTIGQIDLQRSFSFFEADKSVEKKIQNAFKGVVLENGRELRVNRDN